MISVDYFYTQVSEDTLDVEDEGNCVVQVFNDDGIHWDFYTCTSLGWTTCIQMGPFDIDGQPDKYSFNFNRINTEFNSIKIQKNLEKFINDPRKSITQAMEVEYEEFIKDLEAIKFLKEIKDVNE